MNMRKGFTLVELLIVIVIIGILAAAMLLSSGSATAAATASTIVSDLRSMKSATLLFYADSMDNLPAESALAMSHLFKYMDNPEKFKDASDGKFYGAGGHWYVGVPVPADAQVREKLAAKAAKAGIYNGTATAIAGTGTGNNYTNGAWAWMQAR